MIEKHNEDLQITLDGWRFDEEQKMRERERERESIWSDSKAENEREIYQ